MSADSDRVGHFVASVAQDPRVLGVARTDLPDLDETRLLLIVTWDGYESLPAELPRICAPLVGPGAPIEVFRPRHAFGNAVPAAWQGVGVDGSRAEVGLRRAEDLVPSPTRPPLEILHDPYGLLERFVKAEIPPETQDRDDSNHLLAADLHTRVGVDEFRSSRHDLKWIHLSRARRYAGTDPARAALAARIERLFAMTPGAPEGTRVRWPLGGPDEFERFLLVADGEGFKGDRVLFGEAVNRLRELSKREPVFDQGFVVPTFDAVEAGFALGEAVGGCQPPLIPGVYVGVGVTPKDALEFWAAPFVRDPTCSVACVDDTGEREIVERTAGRDPMIATLVAHLDEAFERLPALIDRARDAANESVDPSAVLKTLHLPASFVERAKHRGADALMCSRLTVALAVARAGHDCAPLVARKFGLAAGRVLAMR